MGDEIREGWAVNGEGFVVSRLGSTSFHCDPDELSYDDTIRRRYFTDLIHKKVVPRHLDDWLKQERRSMKETSRFLGYPELPITSNDIKFKHSFEEQFFGEDELIHTQRVKLSNPFARVVSLTSIVTHGNGGKESRLFTCSGIVIDCNTTSNSTMIVTSACLVCHVNDDGRLKAAENLKIKVRFGNDEPCYGSLVSCYLNYNISFIEVKGRCEVRPVPMGGRDCSSDDLEVFAVGQHYLTGKTMVASGRTTSKTNPFDCVELMFSTCKITKCGIGGPLVDSTGYLIGINFYDEMDTPYLPACLILKCLYHVQSTGKVMQPYFGWKLRVIELQHMHKIYLKHQVVDAVAVHEVKNGSPAQLSGICDGDIIVEFCGEPASFLAECAAAVLDKKLFRPERGLEFEVKIVRGEVLKSIRIYTHETLETGDHDMNRWPLPKLEWEVIPRPSKMFTISNYPDEQVGLVFC